MKKLTRVQEKMLNHVKMSIKTFGYPPSLDDLHLLTGTSRTNCDNILKALERKGHIKRIPRISRGIVINESVL